MTIIPGNGEQVERPGSSISPIEPCKQSGSSQDILVETNQRCLAVIPRRTFSCGHEGLNFQLVVDDRVYDSTSDPCPVCQDCAIVYLEKSRLSAPIAVLQFCRATRSMHITILR